MSEEVEQVTAEPVPDTPVKRQVRMDRARELYPEMMRIRMKQGLSPVLNQVEKDTYLENPDKYLGDLTGVTVFRDPKKEALREEAVTLKSKMRRLDNLESFLEHVAEGSMMVAGGSLLGRTVQGMGAIGSFLAPAADVIGTRAGGVLGDAATDLVRSEPDDTQPLGGVLTEDVPLEVGVAAGFRAFDWLIREQGAPVVQDWLQSIADNTDPDRVLSDAMNLTAKESAEQVQRFRKAVVSLKERILTRASADSRKKLFPDIVRRAKRTKVAANRMIDSTLDKVQEVADSTGIDYYATPAEILHPVEQRLSEKLPEVQMKALLSVYKEERKGLAEQVLTKNEFLDWQKAEQAVRRIAGKESAVRIASKDLQQLRAKAKSTFSDRAFEEAVNQIDTFQTLEEKVRNAATLNLKELRRYKSLYGNNANFDFRELKDMDKANRAASYGVFEKSTRELLETTIDTISPEHFETYKNLNSVYQNIKYVEPDINLAALHEEGAVSAKLFDRLKAVVAINRGGPSVRGFLTSEVANQKAQKITHKVLTALDLYNKPATFRNYAGQVGSNQLFKYWRSKAEFFKFENYSALTHVLSDIDSGVLEVPEQVYLTLQTIREGITAGMGVEADLQDKILTGLLKDPNISSLFNPPVEKDISYLEGVSNIIDGRIIDDTGETQEKVRKRVLDDSSLSPTEKYLILDPLNKENSVQGFYTKPAASPIEERAGKGSAARRKEVTAIRKALPKNKHVQEIIKSRELDAVIERAKQ